MRVAHVSDLHGETYPLVLVHVSDTPDVWVWTGDMCPMGPESYQAQWFLDHADRFREVFGEVPVLVMDGNHDDVDAGPALRHIGVNAIDVSLHPITVLGKTVVGFPQIPILPMGSRFEVGPAQLRSLCRSVATANADWLVTHAPPSGILSGVDGDDWGIPGLVLPPATTHHFFGHVHKCRDVVVVDGKTYSNASTGVNLLTI